MPTPLLDPPPGLLSPVFIDHCRAAFREPPELVERCLLELFEEFWADDLLPMSIREVERDVSDKAGNFAERRSWAFRGLAMFHTLPPGYSTRGVGHFIIDGASCRLVRPGFWPALAAMGERRAWSIKRVDLAVDDDSGVLSVDALEAAYDMGYLSHKGAGAMRRLDVRDPRTGTASCGWTVYVGVRTSTAFLRVYDKCAEVLAKRGPAAAYKLPPGRVRLELERKPTKHGAELPWHMLADPAPYFAADCPLLASRAGGVEPIRVGRVVRDQAEADLWAILAHCRNSYGAAIEQAFWALGADATAAEVLVDKLRRPGSRPPVPGVGEVVGGGVPDREFMGPGS